MKSQYIDETPPASEVKTSAVKSVKWAVLGEIISRSIHPIITLTLARLLIPADFGIVGVAMIVIGLARIFLDFGLGKTLIQRKTDVKESANIIFWTNITLSVFLYLVFFINAPLLAKFFHEPKVVDVLRVLCIQIVLFSFISVHQALFRRKFQFKQLFFIRFFSAAVPGFVSLPLALLGYGVWSLVWGSLAGAIVQVFLFWRASPWHPKFSYDINLAKQLFGFSIWIALETFLGWLIIWGDSIVLGHFLGVKELGVYRVGVTFLLLIFGIFFNPLLPIAYSSFSRLQSNLSELKRSFLRLVQLMSVISLPMGVGLAILSKPISTVIFAGKWQGIEIVIAIIAIKDAMAWLVGINPEVFRAIGRPDINSKLLILCAIYYIPVYVIAAPFGLFIFCIARLSVAIISMGFHFYFVNRILKMPFTYLGRYITSPLIGSFVMGVIVYVSSSLMGTFYGWQGWIKLVFIITLGGFSYLFILRLFERDLIKQFFKLALNVVK